MKGIILKDFYENYIIRKNLINWILGIIMLIVVVAVFRTKYVFALSCGLVLPLLGTSMLQFPWNRMTSLIFTSLRERIR